MQNSLSFVNEMRTRLKRKYQAGRQKHESTFPSQCQVLLLEMKRLAKITTIKAH